MKLVYFLTFLLLAICLAFADEPNNYKIVSKTTKANSKSTKDPKDSDGPKTKRHIAEWASFLGSDYDSLNGGDCNHTMSHNWSGNSKQKATNIAQKAAQEAKAATDAQAVAGQQAAHQVKTQLAERAMQAAKAAEAALAGKQAIVEQLEQEVKEAEQVVQEQGSSIQQAQTNLNAAMMAAQQATTQLKTLTSAVQTAQANVGNSEQAAQGAEQELTGKTQLMEAAKNRVEQLLRQLSAARSDFTNTKQAAYKAATAAHEAKVNAARSKRMQDGFIYKRHIQRPRHSSMILREKPLLQNC